MAFLKITKIRGTFNLRYFSILVPVKRESESHDASHDEMTNRNAAQVSSSQWTIPVADCC